MPTIQGHVVKQGFLPVVFVTMLIVAAVIAEESLTIGFAATGVLMVIASFVYEARVRSACRSARANRKPNEDVAYPSVSPVLSLLLTGYTTVPYSTFHADDLAEKEGSWTADDMRTAEELFTDSSVDRGALRRLVARATVEVERANEHLSSERAQLSAAIEVTMTVCPWLTRVAVAADTRGI